MEDNKLRLASVEEWRTVRQNLEGHALELLQKLGPSADALPGLQKSVSHAVEAVFTMAAPNVQVNGYDLADPTAAPAPAAPEYEPVDETLLRRLQEVQAETDRILVHVTEQRRTMPGQLAQLQTETLEALAAAATGSHASFAGGVDALGPIAFQQGGFDAQLVQFSTDVHALKELANTLPALSTKLQNMTSVLEDLPRMQERSRQLLAEGSLSSSAS